MSEATVRSWANRQQFFHDLKPQLKAGARYRFGHSLRIEFAVSSQDSVPWFAPRHVLKEIGSVPILRPKRDKAERMCGVDREVPACRARSRWRTPSRYATPISRSCR